MKCVAAGLGAPEPRSGFWWRFSELATRSATFPLPQPPTQSMTLGPGGLSQSGSSQGLHAQGSLGDAIGAGLPPSSLMQAQIGNGERPGCSGSGLAPGRRVTAEGDSGRLPPSMGDLGPLEVLLQVHACSETWGHKAVIPGPLLARQGGGTCGPLTGTEVFCPWVKNH